MADEQQQEVAEQQEEESVPVGFMSRQSKPAWCSVSTRLALVFKWRRVDVAADAVAVI